LGGQNIVAGEPQEIYIPGKKVSQVSIGAGSYPFVNIHFIMDGCDYSIPNQTLNTTSPVVCKTSRLYGSGTNSFGQLGDSTTSAKNAFTSSDVTNVLAGDYILDIKASYQFSLALTSTGVLYSWGNNLNGKIIYIVFT
jgi:hypothetical protein